MGVYWLRRRGERDLFRLPFVLHGHLAEAFFNQVDAGRFSVRRSLHIVLSVSDNGGGSRQGDYHIVLYIAMLHRVLLHIVLYIALLHIVLGAGARGTTLGRALSYKFQSNRLLQLHYTLPPPGIL
jgi:hypothetical protein